MAVPAAVPSLASPPPLPVLDPTCWATQTFGTAALGDRRRTRRLVRTAAAIAAQPTASLPQQLRQPAAVKATYRLLHEAAVTPAALLTPHLAQTRAGADPGRRRGEPRHIAGPGHHRPGLHRPSRHE